ncbi:MAG TPA: hypothetical protein VI455_12945 [Terriglobia bacterium]
MEERREERNEHLQDIVSTPARPASWVVGVAALLACALLLSLIGSAVERGWATPGSSGVGRNT